MAFSLSPGAAADHVPADKDVRIQRRVRGDPGAAGYLAFLDGSAELGAEYTGHTEKRRRRQVPTSPDDEIDFADNGFRVRPFVVPNGFTAAELRGDVPSRQQDRRYARKVYAQAGLTPSFERTRRTRIFTGPGGQPILPGANGFTFGEVASFLAAVEAPPTTIELLYLKLLEGGNRGVTILPFQAASQAGVEPGSAVRLERLNNTVAHELGHMLLNGPAIVEPSAKSNLESARGDNFMNNSSAPQQAALELTDVGHGLGSRDRVDPAQIAVIHEPPAGTPDFIVHESHADTHGDRADFDWVADQQFIEESGSAVADLDSGSEFLTWGILPPAVSSSQHVGPFGGQHRHKGAGELALPAFAGASFRMIDIVSNGNLFADNDASGRDKALDYAIPLFVKGTNVAEATPGTLVNVFQPGWTGAASSDDHVARWRAPFPEGASFVLLKASEAESRSVTDAPDGEHDGNTQIDAIIAYENEVESFALRGFDGVPPLEGDGFRRVEYAMSGAGGGDGVAAVTLVGAFPALDVTASAADGGGGAPSGPEARTDYAFASSAATPRLPASTDYDLAVQLGFGPNEDPGTLQPSFGGQTLQVARGEAGRFFTAELDVAPPGGGPEQSYLLRGETAAADLVFAVAQPFAPVASSHLDVFLGLAGLPVVTCLPGDTYCADFEDGTDPDVDAFGLGFPQPTVLGNGEPTAEAQAGGVEVELHGTPGALPFEVGGLVAAGTAAATAATTCGAASPELECRWEEVRGEFGSVLFDMQGSGQGTVGVGFNDLGDPVRLGAALTYVVDTVFGFAVPALVVQEQDASGLPVVSQQITLDPFTTAEFCQNAGGNDLLCEDFTVSLQVDRAAGTAVAALTFGGLTLPTAPIALSAAAQDAPFTSLAHFAQSMNVDLFGVGFGSFDADDSVQANLRGLEALTPDSGSGDRPLFSLTLTSAEIDPTPPAPPNGDIDGDGDVDADDRQILLDAFGLEAGDPGFVPEADLDADGAITFVDYQLWLEAEASFNQGMAALLETVPEPGPWLLLVSGAALLAVLARRRRAGSRARV